MAKIPSYRLHKASGQGVATIAGRDYYFGPHGLKTSKAKYQRLVGEYLAQGRSKSFGQPVNDLTIVELLADYLRFAKNYFGEGRNSEFHRIKLVMRTLRALYGSSLAIEFGPLQFKATRETLLTENGKGRSKPRTRQYLNAAMKRIARLFKWASNEGKLPASIYDALRIIPGLKAGRCEAPESKPVLPVSDVDVEATLTHLPKTVAAMAQFQRLTGCRPGEVCNLKPAYIDRSGPVWKACLPEHKTKHHGKTRTIFIGPKAQRVLRPYLLRDANDFCFSPKDSERERRAKLTANRKTPLSCGNRVGTNVKRRPVKSPGTSYDIMAYRRAIHRACVKASIPNWHPNQLRHSAATQIRKEFGLDQSAAILGHSSVGVTQVYAENDKEKALQVALKIG